jgi:hypothetical protein
MNQNSELHFGELASLKKLDRVGRRLAMISSGGSTLIGRHDNAAINVTSAPLQNP